MPDEILKVLDELIHEHLTRDHLALTMYYRSKDFVYDKPWEEVKDKYRERAEKALSSPFYGGLEGRPTLTWPER